MSQKQRLRIGIILLMSTNLFFSQNLQTKSMVFGGRVMFDHAYFFNSSKLNKSFNHQNTTKTGQEFRRIFAYVSGNVATNIEYKLQLNFAGAKVGLRDAYIGFKKIPVIGTVRVGQVKEPIRLEVLNSSNYLTFMERSFSVDLLPIRNSGLLFMGDVNPILSYQLGVFGQADKSSGDDQSINGLAITGRVVGVPIKNTNQFLHIGLAGSYRTYDAATFEANIKPEANISAVPYISVQNITNTDHVNFYNAELAYAFKSFNVQSEYTLVQVYKNQFSERFFTYYAQTSYFLTGEHKKIKNAYTMFDRLKPKHDFRSSGIGALEIAFRYSYINANTNSINAGILENFTLGLNWYLNSNTKLMFNQVYANLQNQKDSHISQIRFQVDF